MWKDKGGGCDRWIKVWMVEAGKIARGERRRVGGSQQQKGVFTGSGEGRAVLEMVAAVTIAIARLLWASSGDPGRRVPATCFGARDASRTRPDSAVAAASDDHGVELWTHADLPSTRCPLPARI